MRGDLALLALLALLAGALAAAAMAAANTYKNDNCADVTGLLVPRAPRSNESALRVFGAARELWAVWRDAEERAAAALLLRVLAEHERCAALRCSLLLCRLPSDVALCQLLGENDLTRIVAGFVPAPEECSAAQKWDTLQTGVRARAPLAAPLAAQKELLQVHAPWAVDEMQHYEPSPSVLTDLLARETTRNGGRAQSESAAQAARDWVDANRAAFEKIRRTGTRIETYRVLAFLCAGEARSLEAAVDAFRDATQPELRRLLIAVEIRNITIDCLDRAELAARLRREASAGGAHRLLGAAVAGAGVPRALALSQHLALVAYDAQPAGEALLAGAEAGALARALRRALAACGWRRVAVLSEPDAAAEAVERELAAAAGALRRVPLSPRDRELSATLRALRAEDARVLVVNAGGAGAARALRLGAAAGLTAAAGCAWLLRERAAGPPPPAELRPLRALRGTSRGAGALAPAFARLERAASLLDALATLAFGFGRLFAEREELRFDHRARGTPGSFRSSVSRDDTPPLPGVESDFAFDSRGVRIPPRALRLEVWSPNAAVPAESRVDACTVPRVRDSPRPCPLPVGDDAFAPRACLGALAAGGAPALLLAALLAGLGARALRRRAAARRLARRRRLRALAGEELIRRQPGAGPELASLLVERERVTLLRALGAGRHGRVWLARLAPGGAVVAAKGPHADAAPAEEGELLREAALLAPLRHAHVLRPLGVCVAPGPPLLLTAVAARGDLLRHLRALRPPGGPAAPEELTRLLREAALALAYLAARGIVHRDVRAANCLVDERRVLRLGDFGMARALRGARGPAPGGADDRSYDCRRRALFPVLWMAPESLARGAFSLASDVWALGVLALELITLGARPFGALGAAEAVRLVKRGGHARLPRGCGAQARALVLACWRGEARARPSAAQVADWLASRPGALQACPRRDARDSDSGSGEAPPPPGDDGDRSPDVL